MSDQESLTAENMWTAVNRKVEEILFYLGIAERNGGVADRRYMQKVVLDYENRLAALRANVEKLERDIRERDTLRRVAEERIVTLEANLKSRDDEIAEREEVAQERSARIATLEGDNRRLTEALKAADSILWMAENYAVAGGSGGPEMRDYKAAEEAIKRALAPQSPPPPEADK